MQIGKEPTKEIIAESESHYKEKEPRDRTESPCWESMEGSQLERHGMGSVKCQNETLRTSFELGEGGEHAVDLLGERGSSAYLGKSGQK